MSDLAIVTVSHNSEADLARLLDSIDRRLRAAPPQVVVVDSASSDGSAALARDRGATVVALEANVGFGAGCNAGLALVDAEVTALVNPDVELLDDGLAALAERARVAQALLAPRLVHADGRIQDSAHPPPGRADDLVPALLPRPLLPPPLRRRYEPWRSDHIVRVGWAIGACLVARTSLLRSLGPFDERAFLFYEDMELCLAAARRDVPPRCLMTMSGWSTVGTPLRAAARHSSMSS